MTALMIRCPQTGRTIYTGIETDQVSLDKAPDVPMHTRCPECGREHMWWKREAWFQNGPVEGEPAATPAANREARASGARSL
jgi:hypothetical protein